MNGFRRLQRRLRAEGWLVEWAMPCCQACAWFSLPDQHEEGPFKGYDVNFSKVLFNYEQDCNLEIYPPDNLDDDQRSEWSEKFYKALDGGYWKEFLAEDEYYADQKDYYKDVVVAESMLTMPPEIQTFSLFCFDGSEQGVKNLKSILPVIEKCGCVWSWDQSPSSKIAIQWDEPIGDDALGSEVIYLEDGTPVWPDLDYPLFCAAEVGDVDELRRLIRTGVFSDSQDLMDDFTVTFHHDDPASFEVFVEQGLDVSQTFDYFNGESLDEALNALIVGALQGCSLWALKRLVELGVDPDYQSPSGVTALSAAKAAAQEFRDDPAGFWGEDPLDELEIEALLIKNINFLESCMKGKAV